MTLDYYLNKLLMRGIVFLIISFIFWVIANIHAQKKGRDN